MSRIPGKPEDKLKLLSKLDQKTLPYLVGDILYFLREHQNVRVVDGPGDGKRDIHSLLPTGRKHITQCKYHNNFQASVSSDETDELVLALNKFGCQAGLFVTTGKISPQAKREYLDNYPGYQLDFLEGVDLVDVVLSSPLLSSIWFDGNNITRNVTKINIPFIIRIVKDDTSLPKDKIPPIINDKHPITFANNWSSTEDFSPYRPPTRKSIYEQNDSAFATYSAVLPDDTTLHELLNHIRAITNHIALHVEDDFLPVVIRFGVPYFSSAFISDKPRNSECDDKIKLYHIEPVSFIINQNRETIYEHKWLLLTNNDWMFVEEINSFEAMYAGWFNRSDETVFMIETAWPSQIFGHLDQMRDVEKEWLEKSLFLVGSKNDFNSALANLDEENSPDWHCNYGPNGLLVAWFHPVAILCRDENITLQSNPAGRYTAVIPDTLDINTFTATINIIRELSVEYNLQEVLFDQAHLISKLAHNDLLPEYKMRTSNSAELYFDYDEIPSPVYTNNRTFIFVRFWEIPDKPAEARSKIEYNRVALDRGGSVYFDPKSVRESGKTYLLSSVSYHCPLELSTDQYFGMIESTVTEHLKLVADYIMETWKDASLKTIHFYEQELGFQITQRQGYHALYGEKKAW